MKILFILELYYPNIGGIEKLFKTLAERLVEEGYEVSVITTRYKKGLPARECLNGVHIRRLRIASRFMFTFFGVFHMFREAMRCDIIHTTSYNAAFPARLAGLLAGKKVIITFHEVWGKLWFSLPYMNTISKTLYYLYEQMILQFVFRKYIAPSDYTAECLQKAGVGKKRIVRIHNGLKYHKYDASKYKAPEKFTFTYFGRLGVSKGLNFILEAAPDFLDKHPGSHLKLILPLLPEKFLKRVKKELLMIPRKRYTILHHLDEQKLFSELQKSTCVMVPSYSEGFCFAAAETIALGVPLIHSGKGALKEVVSGKNILMPTFDTKGLSESLEMAYKNEWTESPVKKFHFEDTVNNYLELYEQKRVKHLAKKQ